jgi:hypothetical protein
LLSSAPRILEGGMSGCIVGWAHSKFGKHEGRDIESLIVEVTQAALAYPPRRSRYRNPELRELFLVRPAPGFSGGH